jgi:hypothetical protein
VKNVKEVLDKALDNDLISVQDWNEGLFTYVIYRIVWETKSHYLLYAVNSEEQAKRIVEGFKADDEYFYKKVRVN